MAAEPGLGAVLARADCTALAREAVWSVQQTSNVQWEESTFGAALHVK